MGRDESRCEGLCGEMHGFSLSAQKVLSHIPGRCPSTASHSGPYLGRHLHNFIEALPKSTGSDTIFVVVDRLGKYAHFIPICHPFNAKSIAALFVKEVLHGFPHSIVSNHDKIFLSHF